MQTFMEKPPIKKSIDSKTKVAENPIQRKESSAVDFLKPNAIVQFATENEKHLGHEAWHVVQQKQDKVTPTIQKKGVNINDNPILERESNIMDNHTGLPNNLKSGIESLSGYSMNDVKVHYNSSKPAQMRAYAYTQGTDIHIAPGQEKHLGHEAWHVVQQKQGRVAPTSQMKGVNINDNSALEHEADVMGAKATQLKGVNNVANERWKMSKDSLVQMKSNSNVIQKVDDFRFWARSKRIISRALFKKHPNYVYRADSRSLEDIKKAGGFMPRNPESQSTLLEHVQADDIGNSGHGTKREGQQGIYTNFVSTASKKAFIRKPGERANFVFGNGASYIYKISTKDLNEHDVLDYLDRRGFSLNKFERMSAKALRTSDHIKPQREWSMEGGIPYRNIVAYIPKGNLAKAFLYTQISSESDFDSVFDAFSEKVSHNGETTQTTMQKKTMNSNSVHEHEANVMGAKATQLKAITNTTPVQWKQSNNGAIQLKNENAPMQFWGLDQHIELTEEAFKLARNSKNRLYTDKDMESLRAGAVFNDVHGKGTLHFGLSFMAHTDEFLNESHHGGMQFLHTMSNDEDAETNKKKQMAWAQFCILTRINKADANDIDPKTNFPRKFQDKKMLPYIRSLGEDNIFFEMMMPAMIHRSRYKDFLEQYPDLKTFTPKERAIFINHYLILNEKFASSLANQTVAEFFQAGHSNLDAGLIASGSLAHMIEDSFANSHAQRTVNIHQDASKSTEKDKEKKKRKQDLINRLNKSNAKDDILSTQTSIMLHANYNEQQSLTIFGKHSKGDGFEKGGHGLLRKVEGGLNNTQGATQAQLAVAYVLQQLDATSLNPNQSQNRTANLLDFIDKTLAVDKNVLALQQIENLKKQNAITQEQIDQIIQDTDLADLDINFINHNVTTTKAGRQYEKTKRKLGHSSFINGKGWMNKETNKTAQKELSKYDDLLKKEQTNTVYSIENKISQYDEQSNKLYNAMNHSEVDEVKEKIRQHATEMLINVISMEHQSNNNTMFQDIKARLISIINH